MRPMGLMGPLSARLPIRPVVHTRGVCDMFCKLRQGDAKSFDSGLLYRPLELAHRKPFLMPQP